MKFKTIIGKVEITHERKKHIIKRYPIIEDYLDRLKEVLKTPAEIRFSSRSDEVLLFYSFFDNIEGGKYISVVVSKTEKSVLTAYLSQRIKNGRKYETQ